MCLAAYSFEIGGETGARWCLEAARTVNVADPRTLALEVFRLAPVGELLAIAAPGVLTGSVLASTVSGSVRASRPPE